MLQKGETHYKMRNSNLLKKSEKIIINFTAILLIMTGFAQPALAIHPAAGPTDSVELEAFMDGVIAAQLEAYHLAGATVAVVKDGALFFAKGYGYADLKERKHVQADKTLFRIASISKLFVWTAVMQLVEQGKLDLNTDINTYLTHFKIPNTYDKPVTLAHLMTHTAGFEEYVIGLFAKDSDRLLPLGDILAQELPTRVRRPGDIVSYSNHGTGMAAYIVEQVSGKSWDNYVEKNILGPLGMANTTFRQPIPETLSANISKGYTYSQGEFQKEAFVYVPLAPVASASTTATDMANFMIAHLNHGRLGNSRILNTKTAQQMHSALFRHAPEVNPSGHGFFDISRNAQWVIGHPGNLLYFHSLMALLPDHGVGLFVSYNTQEGNKAVANTYELFLDRYFPPGKLQSETPSASTKTQLQRFAGSYFSSRRVHRRFTKLGALIGTVKVTLAEDGMLKTIGTETSRWVKTNPLTFQEENGSGTLVFREDDKGRITHMFIGNLPYKALERIGIKDSLTLHVVLALSAILLFLITAVSWPFAALLRWRHDVEINRRTRIPRLAYLITWSACLLFIVIAAVLALGLRDPNAILFGIPLWIRVIIVLSMFATIMTIGAIVYTVVIWKSGNGSIYGRIYYTAVMLALISTAWQLYHWNMLGFHY
jgi:CubicO group peptidase (beta-lactamase class C family)